MKISPLLIYIPEGLLVFVLNMLYFTAIIRTSRNREKYGLLGMEFFADGAMGLAVFLAGAIRIISAFFIEKNLQISRRICMIVPYNLILAWADPMTALSMLLVSIDRLISITRPVFYYKKMRQLQIYLAVGSNLTFLPLLFASFICSYRTNVMVDGYCWTPDTRCPIFNQIYYGLRIAAAAASVVLYIITLFVGRQFIKRTCEQQGFMTSPMVDKRQLSFAKTAGFSCFATVGLYVLPMAVAFLETGKEKMSDAVYIIIIIISNLNSLPKIIIVGWRSKDIQQAIIELMPGIFRRFGIRKTSTVNVVDWKGTTIRRNRAASGH